MKVDCCRDCTERYPGCHDRCEKYQTQRKLVMEERRDLHKDSPYSQYFADVHKKLGRRKNGR